MLKLAILVHVNLMNSGYKSRLTKIYEYGTGSGSALLLKHQTQEMTLLLGKPHRKKKFNGRAIKRGRGVKEHKILLFNTLLKL